MECFRPYLCCAETLCSYLLSLILKISYKYVALNCNVELGNRFNLLLHKVSSRFCFTYSLKYSSLYPLSKITLLNYDSPMKVFFLINLSIKFCFLQAFLVAFIFNLNISHVCQFWVHRSNCPLVLLPLSFGFPWWLFPC